MQVVFTPLAARNIDELHAYIAEQSSEARADSYVERIIAFCRQFETFPERGTQRDDILPGLRIAGFERRATIAFLVMADVLLIEGIFYAGRDFEAMLRDR